MKICIKCNENKDLMSFNLKKSGKYGVSSNCKECEYAKRKENYENNKDKIKQNRRKSYQKNREKVLEQKKKYNSLNKEIIKIKKKQNYQKNKVKILEKRKAHYTKNCERIKLYKRTYNHNNLGKINALSARKYSRKTQATPPWLSKEHLKDIDVFYIKAKEMTKETGVKYQVDHIVPLRGKNVSGLHVPWNLQILTAE